MMRFERLWSTERRIWDWPLGFQHLYFCSFFGVCLCSPSTWPQNWFAASTVICVLRKKRGVGYQRLYRTTVCLCSAHTPTHTHILELPLFRTDEDHFSAAVSHWLPPNFSPGPAEVWRLCWGGGVRKLLFIVSLHPSARQPAVATQDSGSQENPEEWQLTFTRSSHDRLRINFKTTRTSFKSGI